MLNIISATNIDSLSRQCRHSGVTRIIRAGHNSTFEVAHGQIDVRVLFFHLIHSERGGALFSLYREVCTGNLGV